MGKRTKLTIWALGIAAVLSLAVNGLFWYANSSMTAQHAAALGTQVSVLREYYLESVQRYLVELPEGEDDVIGQTISSEKLLNAGFIMTRMHTLDPPREREWSDFGQALVRAGIEVRLVALELRDTGQVSPGCALRFEEARELVDSVVSAMPRVEGSVSGNAAGVGRMTPRISFDEAVLLTAAAQARDYVAAGDARQQARNRGGGGCDPQVAVRSCPPRGIYSWC